MSMEKYIDEDYVCEDYGDVMIWTQVKVTVPLRELDSLVAVMSMINNNLMIEDYSDIDTNLKTCYGDLIDEKILNANKDIASVSVFIPSDRSYMDDLAYIRQRCAELELHAEIELVGVEKQVQARVKKQIEKNQKDYYLREQMKAIREELGEGDDINEFAEYEKGILLLKRS